MVLADRVDLRFGAAKNLAHMPNSKKEKNVHQDFVLK